MKSMECALGGVNERVPPGTGVWAGGMVNGSPGRVSDSQRYLRRFWRLNQAKFLHLVHQDHQLMRLMLLLLL